MKLLMSEVIRNMSPMLRNIFLAGFVLAAGPVLAQSPQSNPTVPSVPPPAASTTPPEKIAPADGSASTSNRLSQQKGTITPPNVDPGMTVTPPRDGSATTPVIPPPASVVPK
jgi:hypothetical protein